MSEIERFKEILQSHIDKTTKSIELMQSGKISIIDRSDGQENDITEQTILQRHAEISELQRVLNEVKAAGF